uniref:Glyco_hydro_42C domain-containing protein n=1 Tax=Steinernema glaseri TaxID=37863 RepID=A0A1I8A4R5_9BILA
MWALKAARRLPKSLQVEWEDGYLAKFPYVWLRDNTFRRPSLVHLDLDLTPQVVDYSQDRLSVLWPPCIASQYSSQFLRSHSIVKPSVDVEEPSPQTTLPGAWKLVPATPVDPLQMMGSAEWGDRAKDIGTVWPHLERVPSLCTVDSLSGVSQVYVVDAVHAFEEMAVRRPEEFAFLQRCTLEYREGPFTARHRIITMRDGHVTAALFNNESRSAEITVESVDEFYACLKSFGRIAWENAHTLEVGPRERLVVDNHRVLIGAPAQFGRRLLLRTFS